MIYQNKPSALASRRQAAYQRLAEINAYQLRLGGLGIIPISLRAGTTTQIVRQWLEEVATLNFDNAATKRPQEQAPASSNGNG